MAEETETVQPYYAKGKISGDELLTDDNFLTDAQQLLLKRTGEMYTSPEEILTAYREQFRVSSVNEVSALKDLSYLSSKTTTQKDRDRMGRLYLAYDNLTSEGTNFGVKMLDYAEGIVTSPSTYLGLISGGVSKLAGVGGTRAAVALARSLATKGVKDTLKQRVVKYGVPAALKTAAVEGGIEAGADTARQEARMLTGIQKEFSPLRLAASSLAAAVPAAGISGALQTGRGAQKEALATLLNTGAAAKATRVKEADEAAKEALRKNKSIYEELVKSSGTLQALEKTRVARGAEIRGNKAFGSTILDYAENVDKDALVDLDINLNISILERMTAATVDLLKSSGASTADIIKRMTDNEGRPLRIIDILANEMEGVRKVTGKGGKEVEQTGGEAFQTLIKRYQIEFSDVAALFAHEFSEAGRVLNIASQAKRNVVEFIKATKAASVTKTGEEGSLTYVGKADKLIKNEFSFWQIAKNMDAVRKGLMVMQPATTVRNTVNAGFRTVLHAFENMAQGATQIGLAAARGGDKDLFRLGLDNITSPLYLAKYIAGDTVAARGIQALFSEASPVAAQRLYRSMADVVEEMPNTAKENVKGVSGGLVRMARYGNAINTLSDNAFKRAMFASELTKEVGGLKNLNKFIREGRFGEIPSEAFENATTRALELTYQKTYNRGTIGQAFTNIFSQPGLSGIIPFPRFIANSLEFAYQHAPIIGTVPLERLRIFGGAVKQGKVRTGRDASKIIAQQITGAGMMSGALALRAAMGNETKWHEIEVGGDLFDVKALFGPFAVWMVFADVVNRASQVAERADGAPLVKGVLKLPNIEAYQNTVKDPAVWNEVLSELSQSKAGSQAFEALAGIRTPRGGMDLSVVGRAITEWQETGSNVNSAGAIADIVGDYLGSFAVPFGTLKDIEDLLLNDEERLYYKDTDLVDPLLRLQGRLLRSFRPVPNIGERIVSESGGYLKSGPPISGIVKATTGATGKPERTAVATELVRLNLSNYDAFPKPFRDKEMAKAMKEMYASLSTNILADYILTDDYLIDATSGRENKQDVKRNKIKTKIKEGLGNNNVKALDYYIEWSNANLSGDELKKAKEKLLKVKYDAISQDDINATRARYKSVIDSENDTRGTNVENSFDKLPLDQRIVLVDQYKTR